MKHYGIDRQKLKNKLLYELIKKRMWILKTFRGGVYIYNYKDIAEGQPSFLHYDNSIPKDKYYKIHQIVVSDLISRDDLGLLQKGLKKLIKKRLSSKFMIPATEGINQMIHDIECMDSTLLSWRDQIDCGMFDFEGSSISELFDYFSLRIRNINPSFLSLEFTINFKPQIIEKINALIETDYKEKQGYLFEYIGNKTKKSGAVKRYTVTHFNESGLKADAICENIDCLEWEFFNALKSYLPCMLFFKNSIVAPRIEIYKTDIDYHDSIREFWLSVGLMGQNGQFIDQNEKMFFQCELSGVYERYQKNRIMLVVKDDKPWSEYLDYDDVIYEHMKKNAVDYFKFMFLSEFSKGTGKVIVSYKSQLDKIKLKKNKLKRLLKLRYEYSCAVDLYKRYINENSFDESEYNLSCIYKESDEKLSLFSRPFCTTHDDFVKGKQKAAEVINVRLQNIDNEFLNKIDILQQLSDYKNQTKGMRLNIITLFVGVATLIATILTMMITIDKDLLYQLIDWIQQTLNLLSLCMR